MTATLYNQKLLQLAAGISHIGRLPAPQASADAVSRLCGSKVHVELSLAEGRVAEYAQEVAACALGQVSCAVMAREIIGCTPQELHMIAAQMRAMLKDDAADAPTGDKWADLYLLAPVRDYPARHASTLLVFDAVEDCLHQLGA